MSAIPTILVLKSILDDDHLGLQQLISKGANVRKLTEREGWSYLHKSLLMPRKSPTCAMLQFLIDSGLDVNLADYMGWTPLHLASRHKGRSEVAKLLLAKNASVDPRTIDGETPLALALEKLPFDRELIEVLIEHGGSPYAELKGLRIIDKARTYSHGENDWLAGCLSRSRGNP